MTALLLNGQSDLEKKKFQKFKNKYQIANNIQQTLELDPDGLYFLRYLLFSVFATLI